MQGPCDVRSLHPGKNMSKTNTNPVCTTAKPKHFSRKQYIHHKLGAPRINLFEYVSREIKRKIGKIQKPLLDIRLLPTGYVNRYRENISELAKTKIFAFFAQKTNQRRVVFLEWISINTAKPNRGCDRHQTRRVRMEWGGEGHR